jgi:hypothetical protein
MRKTNKQFKANALTAAPPARSAARDAVRAIRRTEALESCDSLFGRGRIVHLVLNHDYTEEDEKDEKGTLI